MKKTIIILTIISASIALLFAQTPAGPASEQQDPSAPAVITLTEQLAPAVEAEAAADEGMGADEITIAEEIGEDAMIEEGRISLRLKDAELKDVIRMFSALSDANIIVPALGGEKGADERKIDVNLENVEWQPALEAILDTQGLELHEKIPDSKVYSIRTKTPGAPEATELEIFKLNYASVNAVSNLVGSMVGAGGSLSVFPERNVVVVQAVPKALQSIASVMAQIDLPRQQVFIESKFLELSDTAQRDLGISWQVLGGYEVGVKGIGGTYGYTDSKMDILGLAGDTADDIPVPGIPDAKLTTLVSAAGVSTLDAATVARTLGATLSATDFKLILSALEQEDGVEIVSNPKIIVANEEEATIHIGTREPNIHITTRRGTQDNPGGDVSVELDKNEPYFEDGVKVVVKPTINTSSNIMVRITPEITTFIGRKVVNQNGLKLVDYPISRTKKINTVFSLQSGQTAAIGGLTQVSESTKEKKIPLLGSIPFLGRFFSYEQKVRDQNETIIFVTVTLANPSSIGKESGLPENTRLARRHQIREDADLRVDKAEVDLLRSKENSAMKEELKCLREANHKLIEKQKKNAPVENIFEMLEEEPVAGDLDDADMAEVEAGVEEM